VIVRAVGSVTAGLLGVLSAVAVGCGGSDSALLSQTDAAGLKDTLQQLRSAVDARDCSAATARLRELRSQRGNLPGTVDRELRVRLREEITNKLAPAVEAECDAPETVTQPTTTEPAPTGPTGPVAPEPTEPTQTTETTETSPPDDTTETTPTPPVDPGTTTPGSEPKPVDPTRDPGGFGDGTGEDG
jgi:hypothetical protein